MYALSKVGEEDTLTQSLIKVLATLLIVSEINVQAATAIGPVVPTTELLAWALNVPQEDIAQRLEALALRRAVVYRRSDGYWTFTRGSDIDLDAELKAALDRHTPSQQQIRQILERDCPLPFYLPRGYNQERYITRFFQGLYCWPHEVKNTCTETFLKQLGTHGYADGAIVYILTTNAVEREQAINTVRTLPSGRLVYVIADQPLLITEPVRELFALGDLSNNPSFMQQDERLAGEISFFVEDAQRRLGRALAPFLEPNHLKATWWWYENSCWQSEHQKVEDASRLLS